MFLEKNNIDSLTYDLYNYMYDTDYYNFCDNGSNEKNLSEIKNLLLTKNINGIIQYLKLNVNESIKQEETLGLISRLELLQSK